MRHRVGGAALVALVTMLLAGCGPLAGTDGDLTDDWSAMGAAEAFVPLAEACHDSRSGHRAFYEPVDCAEPHSVETVGAGVFSGEYAQRTTPPPIGSAGQRAAFVDCDARVRRFVGGDWRGARLAISVGMPTPWAWASGSRWYRCNLFEYASAEHIPAAEYLTIDLPVKRTGSLRGALATSSSAPVRLQCFNEDEAEEFWTVRCDKPHRLEYVGVWKAPSVPFNSLDRYYDAMHTGCRSVLARYLGVSDPGKLHGKIGTWIRIPWWTQWESGDRGVRCFVWSDGRSLTRSVRGGGPRALSAR